MKYEVFTKRSSITQLKSKSVINANKKFRNMSKRIVLITFALAASFCFGFAYNNLINKSNNITKMKKVTGIGGIFFKCKDPKKMKEWYKTHLRLNTNDYGATFEWREAEDSTKKASTTWSPFAETTKYFEPSAKDFMINYRVDNLEALVEELKKEGHKKGPMNQKK